MNCERFLLCICNFHPNLEPYLSPTLRTQKMARPKDPMMGGTSTAFLEKCEKERIKLQQKLADQLRLDLNR